MIYAIIWFGGAWIYWLIWAAIHFLGIPASAEFLIFLVAHMPAIIIAVAIVMSVAVYRKRKKSGAPAQKEEYDRKKHFMTLLKLTGAILVTIAAYIWLLCVIASPITVAH